MTVELALTPELVIFYLGQDNRNTAPKDAQVRLDSADQENVPQRLRSDANPGQLLSAAEVADLFRVSAKTVGRWGRSGALPLYRTIRGHHRYRLGDVRALLGRAAGEAAVDD